MLGNGGPVGVLELERVVDHVGDEERHESACEPDPGGPGPSAIDLDAESERDDRNQPNAVVQQELGLGRVVQQEVEHRQHYRTSEPTLPELLHTARIGSSARQVEVEPWSAG